MNVIDDPGGGHSITTTFGDQVVELVYVRPVGTLQMSFADRPFSENWVPQLIEALQLAERIASRDEPWTPWEE